MSEEKLCKDCKWCERERERVGLFRTVSAVKSYARCLHPASRTVLPPDRVTGEVRQQQPEYCGVVRLQDMPCGIDADLFEPTP